MSLDERLMRGLHTVDDAAPPDIGLALNSTLRRARTKRSRQVLSTAAVLVVLLAGSLGAWLARSDPTPTFANEGPALSPQPIPSHERRLYGGAEIRYPVGPLLLDTRSVDAFAYVSRSGGSICLVVAGTSGGQRCLPSFESSGPSSEEEVTRSESLTVRFKPPVPCSSVPCAETHASLIWGISVDGVRGIRLSGDGIAARAADILRLPDRSSGLFALLLPAETPLGSLRTVALGANGRVFTFPGCGTDQYTPDISMGFESIATKTTGEEYVNYVDVSLQLRGLRGQPLPCILAVQATLTIQDGDGAPLEIDGNGSEDQMRILARTATSGFPRWTWRNWCGPEDQATLVIKISDGRELRRPTTTVPSCLDHRRPSTLEADPRAL